MKGKTLIMAAFAIISLAAVFCIDIPDANADVPDGMTPIYDSDGVSKGCYYDFNGVVYDSNAPVRLVLRRPGM